MDTVRQTKRDIDVRKKLDETLDTMRRAAAAAVLKGDPLAEQLTALALSVEALGQICDVNAKTHFAIEERLRAQAKVVTNGAIEKVHAEGVQILDQLAPRLVAMVEHSSRKRLVMWRMRSIIGTTAVALLALAVSGSYVYAIGYTAGRTNGELVGTRSAPQWRQARQRRQIGQASWR